MVSIVRRVLAALLITIGSATLALAVWVWITSDYPDVGFGGPFFGLFFESGIGGLLQTQANWLRVILIAVPGLALLQSGRALWKKESVRQ